MPSLKLILTIVVVSAATLAGVEHYKRIKGG
jgi:hypothetical protein